jgi:hypothetical protein
MPRGNVYIKGVWWLRRISGIYDYILYNDITINIASLKLDIRRSLPFHTSVGVYVNDAERIIASLNYSLAD